jgi:hypothetical protein
MSTAWRSRVLPASHIGLVVRVAIFVGVSLPNVTCATPITIFPETVSNLRTNRGINDVGLIVGDRNEFGANIKPASGSTVTGNQGGLNVGPSPCLPSTQNPNGCRGATTYNATRAGSWLLTFKNGADIATATTPTLSGADVLIPFPMNVSISGSGVRPTFQFVVPATLTPEAMRIEIYDKSVQAPAGLKDVIHNEAISGSSRSYTIPGVLSTGQRLVPGKPYVLAISLIRLRSGFTEGQFLNENNSAMILNRSLSFFEFTPLTGSAPGEVFLPSVGPDPDPADSFGAAFQFGIDRVGPDRMIFIDPFVAVGYEYAIGPGDPNFASVFLPDVGGGMFTVSFGSTAQAVAAGVQFFFPPGGVPAFSVRGIQRAAGVDPANVTAFITGLTFVQSGGFTGTMTPVLDTALPTTLATAVLPGSRSVQVNSPATVFASVINTGGATATRVGIGLGSSVPATLSFQTTDSTTNQLTGTPDTPVDIRPGELQTFLIALTPTGALGPSDVAFAFSGTNADPAPVISGVNTLLLSASTMPTPDIVALAASGDPGIVDVPGVTGTGAFAVATVNVGTGAMITASADTGSTGLPLGLSICQTVPATGACRGAPSAMVTTQIDANATPTFAIFVAGTGTAIPFDPAHTGCSSGSRTRPA